MKYRILAIGLGVTAAGVSCHDAALAYWRKNALGYVPRYLVGDPVIAVSRAEYSLIDPAGRPLDPAALEANARAALRKDPLDATAVFELGVVREQEHAGTGRAAFALSEKLSRRELANQIELEAQSVDDGDTGGAVTRLDRIFTISPALANTLFPQLVQTLDNLPVLAEFTKYARRPWFPALIGAAIEGGVNPASIQRLLDAAQGNCEPTTLKWLRMHLLARAIAAHDYTEARDIVAHLPAGTRAALDMIGFSTPTSDPQLAPLSWNLANDNVKAAQLIPGKGLTLSIGPEQTGIVAERVTLLPPGRYELTQTIFYDDTSPRAAITWDVGCEVATATPVWHQPVPQHSGSMTYRSTFVILRGCQAEHWHLHATGATGQFPSTAEISRIALVAR